MVQKILDILIEYDFADLGLRNDYIPLAAGINKNLHIIKSDQDMVDCLKFLSAYLYSWDVDESKFNEIAHRLNKI